MDREKDFKLTDPELRTELLKRMEYREEARQCGNCKYYYRTMSLDNISKCCLIPFIDLNIHEDGYCGYYQQTECCLLYTSTIESAFGRFQQQVMHKLYNYTGQNVTATKESSHVNIDLIMKNISQLPTLEEMKEQYLKCRLEWNSMPHPTSETGMTRMEMYTALNSPKAEQLDEYEVQELFKLLSKDSVK